jgi:superfamily II RNA helicase
VRYITLIPDRPSGTVFLTWGHANYKLRDVLPAKDVETVPDDLLMNFLQWVETRKITLYPAQEEAILELFDGKNVILNTPTGSGKSLVALALHFESVARGRRSVYTCPIKALVNEKWMALCNEFGPENVGLSTGDATVNRNAPILCCTAEILSNMALHEGETLAVADVVMDEFHYYSDRERGVAWQVPLLTLPQARFLLMSATIGTTDFFEREMTKHTGKASVTVRSTERPVPLEYTYSDQELSNQVQKLVNGGKSLFCCSFYADFRIPECTEFHQSGSLQQRRKNSLEQSYFGSALFKSLWAGH